MSAARVAELFDACADLDPSAARIHLDAACKDDAPDVRAAVERLLALDRALPTDFLAPPTAPAEASTVSEGARAAERGSLPESARVGRYLILRKLGDGGMGDVYAAFDESLDRKVALKVLRTRGVSEASLRREAQALARLSHPNVVQVHEVGEHEGRGFVAMELVAGTTLKAWLDAKPRPAEEILRMFLQCGHGLVAAHEAGIVHRDFKPTNVMVSDDGRARVVDFGIAAFPEVARPSGDDEEPLLAGTPGFMSPEQWSGQPVTPASDQFSFAVALYRALFGASPFAGDDMPALRNNVLAGALRRPPAASVPEFVAPILLRGLARHPAARYDTLRELLQAIERELPHDPNLDPGTSRRGRRILATVMIAGAVAVLAGVTLHGGLASLRTARDLLAVSTVVFGIAIAGIIALRRELLPNRFGARMAAVVLVGSGSLVLHRLIAARFDQPVAPILAADMVSLGCQLVLAASLLQSRLVWGAIVMFGGGIVATFVPALGAAAMVVASVALFATVLVAWKRS